jgi:hypothetical protein
MGRLRYLHAYASADGSIRIRTMMKLLRAICLALVCTVMLPTPITANTVATGSLKEMVYELPSDSGKLYLTVAGTSNDPQYKALCKLFNSSPEYRELRDQYQYTQLAKGSAMYQGRYTNEFTDFPCVRVQSTDGSRLKEWSGDGIPDNATLKSQIEAQCFDSFVKWRKNRPKPDQGSVNVTPVENTDTVQPVDNSTPAPDVWSMGVWTLVACFATGLVLRAVKDVKDTAIG